MGVLNFENSDEKHKRRITSALTRRGWLPDLKSDWEIHGPRPDMDYEVYVGTAIDADGEDRYVAIYPKAIYEIDKPSDWWKKNEDMRVYCKLIQEGAE